MINEKSFLQKLKNKAKSKGLPFQLVLQLFCQEEFLRRLEKSEFRDCLILKGGLLLFSYSGFEGRPTMDIDFLAMNISNDKINMRKIVSRICQINTENNFIDMEIKSIEDIAKMKAYHGVSLKIMVKIANTRTPFNIDIGFGDVIVPEVGVIEIPTQMDGFIPPRVASYSLESVIAEKLEAMFDRMETTGRMKDYYDIYYLAYHYDFNGDILAEAIRQTFQRRGTKCDTISLEHISRMHQNQDMTKRWDAFIKKTLVMSLEFKEVVELINIFVQQPIISIEEDKKLLKKWSKEHRSYIDM